MSTLLRTVEALRREYKPLLGAEKAAEMLDYPATPAGVKAFREWARRKCAPTAHRGRRVLYGRDELLELVGAGHRVLSTPRLTVVGGGRA